MTALLVLLSFFRDLDDVFSDRKTRLLLIWVGILLLVGTTFYHFVEGWSAVDSFYLSVVTLTTVGYGNFSPATTSGKLFTTVFIFLGISIMVVFANTLARKHALRVSSRVYGTDAERAANQEGAG